MRLLLPDGEAARGSIGGRGSRQGCTVSGLVCCEQHAAEATCLLSQCAAGDATGRSCDHSTVHWTLGPTGAVLKPYLTAKAVSAHLSAHSLSQLYQAVIAVQLCVYRPYLLSLSCCLLLVALCCCWGLASGPASQACIGDSKPGTRSAHYVTCRVQ